MAYRYRPELPNAQTGDTLLVIHDFEARSGDELNLKKGDRIELLELDDGFGDGWYLGKSVESGVTGLFPGVYTTVAPKLKGPAPGPRIAPKPTPSLSPTNRVSNDSNVIHISSDDANRAMPKHAITAEPIAIPASSVPLNIQRSISETMVTSDGHGQDSPVMNETLSVIDEHMTEMNTPRHSVIGAERRGTNDSGSEYSSHLDRRMSYITGHETDDEENDKLIEEEVVRWTPAQVSQHLRQLGIEGRHCEIFEEQEISGEVLLGMDRSSIFMKEFDLGVVGRRLRTWHKIKAFQDEIKGPRPVRRATPSFSGGDSSAESLDPSQGRGGTGPILPRIPSLMEKPGVAASFRQSRQGAAYAQPQPPAQDQFQASPPVPPHAQLPGPARSNEGSPVAPFASPGRESPRPSAASVRELGHARRHSSMGEVPTRLTAESRLAGSPASPGPPHKKQSSFDRSWTMSGLPPSFNSRLGFSLTQSPSPEHPAFDTNEPRLQQMGSLPDELDRGYFSGGELDYRRARNVLKKRDSMGSGASHSRQSSTTEEHKRRSSMGGRRHSRLASADSVRDVVPTVTSSAAKAYYSSSLKAQFRSASARLAGTASPREMPSPAVTHLEPDRKSSPALGTFPSPQVDAEGSSDKRASPQLSLSIKNSVSKARRGIGLRAISDAVTGSEKALVASSSPLPSPVKESPVQSPTMTGSSTPSAASKSFDLETADAPSKGANGVLATAPPLTSRRSKSKKDTSAYTRGLERTAPRDQIANCDYSGWMKKKSSNLMTTWKPRLFILRGRRLSYYYSENDDQERGLIDISCHRVLPADQDIVTSLHATLTGAVTSPVSPDNAVISTAAATEAAALSNPYHRQGTDGMFIFKLVPPRSGISRAVNFTKPTVHYFAVDNIKQGRLWMAALMKATIDRDVNRPIETTNKQKTISLKQARAMNQRPPALMGVDDKTEGLAEEPKSDETGLNIRGLSFDENLGATSNGNAHELSGSADVAPYPPLATPQAASVADIRPQTLGGESGDDRLTRSSTNTSSHQPETVATRFA